MTPASTGHNPRRRSRPPQRLDNKEVSIGRVVSLSRDVRFARGMIALAHTRSRTSARTWPLVAAATGATTVFGHSFGGLVALETARRRAIFDQIFVYEPGLPLRRQFQFDWLDDYQRLLERGDRRGAFAAMVKHAGFAPRPLTIMPLPYIRARACEWPSAASGGPDGPVVGGQPGRAPCPSSPRRAERRTVRHHHRTHRAARRDHQCPEFINRALLTELAQTIPDATAAILPGLGHLAPEQQPEPIAAAVLAHPRQRQRPRSGPASLT